MSFVKIEVLVTDRELTVSETWLNISVNLLHGSSLLVAEFLFGIRVRKDGFVVESTRQSSLRLQSKMQSIPEKEQRVPWLNIILFSDALNWWWWWFQSGLPLAMAFQWIAASVGSCWIVSLRLSFGGCPLSYEPKKTLSIVSLDKHWRKFEN